MLIPCVADAWTVRDGKHSAHSLGAAFSENEPGSDAKVLRVAQEPHGNARFIARPEMLGFHGHD